MKLPNTAWCIRCFVFAFRCKKNRNQETGIAFDFLADTSPKEKVMTGHDNGVITLNIDEADEAARVKHKQDLGERYRTLLGHFRHEIGHYYWEVLIKNTDATGKIPRSFRRMKKKIMRRHSKNITKMVRPLIGASIL